MEAQDLRVGNYVLRGWLNPVSLDGSPIPTGDTFEEVWSPCKIVAIGIEKVLWSPLGRSELYKNPYENIKPISLTEEWLLNFGFVKKDSVFFKARFQVQKFANWTGFMFCEGNSVLREIKYVHTLQNVYFFLTEQELTNQ